MVDALQAEQEHPSEADYQKIISVLDLTIGRPMLSTSLQARVAALARKDPPLSPDAEPRSWRSCTGLSASISSINQQ